MGSLPWRAAALVAALAVAFVATRVPRPSRALRELRRQVAVGRAHYDSAQWAAAEAALGAPVERWAAALRSPEERVQAWDVLVAAAAHRAKVGRLPAAFWGDLLCCA